MIEKTAERLVSLLKEKGRTIALAESCTGGKVAAAITDVPGASEVFELGIVSYSERIKNEVLEVYLTTLMDFTVYSAQTANEMALGAVAKSDADFAIGITGLAGPDGGTKEKPVGLVYIAVGNFDDMKIMDFHFTGSRKEIREKAAEKALLMAITYAEEIWQ